MSNDRNDEQEGRGDDRIATANRDHTATTSREPMLPGKDGKDPAEVKLSPPKGEGGHKDGVLTEEVKEPKGHEIGTLDDVAAGPGRALHDELASQFDQVGQHETLMDAPGADLVQGRDGGLPEGSTSIPGGGHDTSGRTTTQESPIDMSGPGGTGGSTDGKPGGSKPGGYDKPGKDYLDKTVDIGSKEAVKSGASQGKDTDNSLKWNKEWEKKDAEIREAAAKAAAEAEAKAEAEAAAEAEAKAEAEATVDTEQDSGGSNDGAPDEAPVDPFGDDPDAALVQPTDPEYDGPQGISGVQTEAFKNEFLQSQWNAKQDSTINPTPNADASLQQAEMWHSMDDMVTTPADAAAGGPPKIDTGTPLVGGDQPIDFGPDHFEEGGGYGPYDDNLKGDFLYNVPKLSQDGGAPSTGSGDADGSPILPSADIAAFADAHLVDELDRTSATNEGGKRDTQDEGPLVAGRLDPSVADFGAGEVVEPRPAFGRGELTTEESTVDPRQVDPARLDLSEPQLIEGRAGATTTHDGSTPDDGTAITAIDVGPTDDLVTSRHTHEDDEDHEDEPMEYDPGLEPIE